MLEKWKNDVDKGKVFGALLTDLSKALDCLPHELIIAKLNAYGFDLPALKLMNSYLLHRKQRTKVNHEYSSWEEILFGVPKGSILGHILFNIFLSDLFFVISDTGFLAMLTIILYMILVIALMMQSHLYKNQQKNCFNGSLIVE